MSAASLSHEVYYLPGPLFSRSAGSPLGPFISFYLETPTHTLRPTSNVTITGNPSFLPPVVPILL